MRPVSNKGKKKKKEARQMHRQHKRGKKKKKRRERSKRHGKEEKMWSGINQARGELGSTAARAAIQAHRQRTRMAPAAG